MWRHDSSSVAGICMLAVALRRISMQAGGQQGPPTTPKPTFIRWAWPTTQIIDAVQATSFQLLAEHRFQVFICMHGVQAAYSGQQQTADQALCDTDSRSGQRKPTPQCM